MGRDVVTGARTVPVPHFCPQTACRDLLATSHSTAVHRGHGECTPVVLGLLLQEAATRCVHELLRVPVRVGVSSTRVLVSVSVAVPVSRPVQLGDGVLDALTDGVLLAVTEGEFGTLSVGVRIRCQVALNVGTRETGAEGLPEVETDEVGDLERVRPALSAALAVRELLRLGVRADV